MMRDVPPSVLATWPLPNYVDPHRNPATIALYVINGVFLGLATIAVAARLYTRIVIRNWFGLDDLCVILAFIPAIGVAACVILGNVRYSWNAHIWDVPLAFYTNSSKLLFAAKLLWSITSCTIRMSLLFFYYRVLDYCEVRRYRWVLHIVMAFVVSVMVIYLTMCIFTCIPVHAYWQFPPDPRADCMNEGVTLLIASVLNTFSEFLVAVLPIPVVMHLRMDRKQRWEVISLLSLGITVSVVGAVRTYYVWLSEIGTYDVSWYSVPHWICAAVEIDLALICACAPALRPLVSRVFDRFGSKIPGKPLQPDRSIRGKSVTTANGKTRLRTNASEKYKVLYASHASTVMCQTIDFNNEGFEEDDPGYGHTVSVTASGHHKTRRERKGSSNGKGKPEDEKEREDIPTELNEVPPFEIMARRSLDIRESFHASIMEGKTGYFWPYGKYNHGSRDMEKDVESSETRFDEYELRDRKSSGGSQAYLSDRRRSSTSTKKSASEDGLNTRVHAGEEEDRNKLVSSSRTVVRAVPTQPPPALLRNGDRSAAQDRGGALHRRETSQGSWWEFDFGFATTSQEDKTMWSHAFEKVFTDEDARNSWRS